MIRFPAEWEPQSAVLIAWPHETGDFIHLEEVETSYHFIAETISQYEKLFIVCRDQEHESRIRGLIESNDNIVFIHAKVNDIWVRDTVFLTVEEDGKPLLLNLRFNGWGEKYPHDDDNALNQKLLASPAFEGVRSLDIDFILEGGSVESDGRDTIMTTRQCLLNPNRNKELSKHEIARQLGLSFGAARVFWIDQPNLPGDDTDAHIDTLARFCSFDTIAYTASDDETNPQYDSLKNMENQLQALRTRGNKPYRLVPLPLPKALFDEDGRQLPANYSNFLIINQAVMVPVYDDPMDAVALERLAGCFPEHKIIPTPCRPLVHQYGSLHCMTMQFPAGVFK
ncbi:agmatine deiminase family protein [Methylomicrobium lacus]|uniref:agmatine deiminase family protein n=1 Tax=Methylomicrobium lacus TaxID=136992 RepID=UPI0035A8E360